MPTLLQRIVSAAAHAEGRTDPSGRPSGITFVVGGAEEHVSWPQMLLDAQAAAGGLQAMGIGPGIHVALLGPTTRRHVTLIEAVWLSGATLVVLPLPMRLGSIEEFVDQTRRRILHADISLVLIDRDLAPFFEPQPGDPTVVIDDELVPAVYAQPDLDSTALAVLQYTSGSTADPKGVVLPHATVCANLDAVVQAAGIDLNTDVMVSWLPLYHDMGLVGFCMLPMTTGLSLVLGAPQDFLGAPRRWMEWVSIYRGSVTAGPNFAWVLATRALHTSEPLDLSSMRIALNGAEPVDAAATATFVETAVAHQFPPGAVFPAFGMAELVIGGAFPTVGRGLTVDVVDRARLESEARAVPVQADDPNARTFAKLGRALPGLELRIVDVATGATLAERHVGELQIRGTSVTSGYYKRDDANAELFADGWLRTGDLGYLVDAELILCGRMKDVIIIAGRNVFPDEIERAVGEVEGVRAGNVIAFGVPGRAGKESVVVVVESRSDDVELLRKLVAERAREACGIPPKDVVVVAAGSLPKTSSGKLQRAACRARYLNNQR